MAGRFARWPWQIKVLFKLVASRAPLDARFWRPLGLFRAGAMDDPEYARRVFQGHLARAGLDDLRGRSLLELGPGDSLFTAVLAAQAGCERCELVDAAPIARREMRPYRRLLAQLSASGRPSSQLEAATSLEELLSLCRARYSTEGLTSLRRLEDATLDLSFSHAVLEHVPRDEFAETVAQLHRTLKPHGVSSHRVDLRDHLGGRLDHLRFAPEWWESPRVAQAGFYTNRLRMCEMCDVFRQVGFDVAWLRVERWPTLPTPRATMHECFQGWSDEELSIRGFDVLLRKH